MLKLALIDLQTELEAVLVHPRDNEVRVLVAPPGSGKSVFTREAVVQLFVKGRVRRVLWATRDTRGEKSLGAEAMEHFNKLSRLAGLGDLASLIRGREAALPSSVYRRQLKWTTGPGIKVISHAHLPIFFNPLAPRAGFLAEVDLLVIDEDPVDSLLHSSHPSGRPAVFNLQALQGIATPDPVTQGLIQLLGKARGGNFTASETGRFPTVKRTMGDFRLDDAAFYKALDLEVLTWDWPGFEKTLLAMTDKQDERHAVPLIVSGFQEDVEAYRLSGCVRASRRFGLRWTDASPADLSALRYNLHRPVTLSVPTLILDGYADQQLYEAILTPQVVKVVPLGTMIPLVIEYNSKLHLDSGSERKGRGQKQLQHRKQLVEEIAAFHVAGSLRPGGPRKIVLLTNKELSNQEGRWRGEVNTGLNGLRPGLAGQVEHAYWMNGRGLNAYSGYDVIAMTRPVRPEVHWQHNMAALYPYDGGLRRAAHAHMDQSELLQMLHRGRQPYHPEARILTAFNPGLPAKYATSTEYSTHKAITSGSNNARSADAVLAFSRELHQLLGGVPRLALQGLNLVASGKTTSKSLDRATSNLRSKVKRSKMFIPHLKAWLAGQGQQYGDVKPSNSAQSNRQQAQALAGIGLDLHTIQKSQCGKHGRQVVHAKTPELAASALTKLLSA